MKENMAKNPDFWGALLNGIPLGVLFAGFFFALLGVLLNALLGTKKRDPASPRTPFKFSWGFFFSDNTARLLKNGLTTLIVIFLSLRFVDQLIAGSTGLSMGYAFVVGFGIDEAIQRLKNYRDKLKNQ